MRAALRSVWTACAQLQPPAKPDGVSVLQDSDMHVSARSFKPHHTYGKLASQLPTSGDLHSVNAALRAQLAQQETDMINSERQYRVEIATLQDQIVQLEVGPPPARRRHCYALVRAQLLSSCYSA